MFKLFATIGLCAAITVTSEPVSAQGSTKVTSLVTMNGKCHKLVLGGENASEICKPTVLNVTYANGKSSFMFVAEGLGIISFYGTDSSAKGNKAVITVEQTTLKLEMANSPTTAPATGTCSYTNPYTGPSLVQCSAVAAGEIFQATFVSDGSKPDVKEF